MLSYVRGVQRRLVDFGFPSNVFVDPIFAHRDEGLKALMNNKFSVQQSRGATTISHKFLTIDDVRALFDSECLNRNTSTEFRIN